MTNNNNYTITRNERKGETWYNLEGINTNWENGYNCAVASSIKELIKYMRRARALNPLATFTIDNSLNPVEVATITADAAKLFTAPKAPKYKNHSQDPAALLKIMRQIAKANNKEGRYNMECIYFDKERSMAVATDAHRLIASRAVYEQYPHFAGCMVNFENGHCYKCEEDNPFKSETGRYPVWYNAIPKNPGKPITLYQQPAVLSLVSNQCAIGTNRTTGQPVCVNGKWYNELLPYFPAALCNDTPFRAVTSQTEELIVLIMPMMYDDDLPQYLNTLATDTTDTTTTYTPSQDTTDTTSQNTTTDTAALLSAGVESGHVIICQPPTNQKTARAVACTAPRIITPMPTPTGQKFTPIFATEEAFVRYDNFHCRDLERVPVYFMNQGRRLFVCNMPNEYKTRHDRGGWYDAHLKEARQDVENYFSQLNTNGGQYFKFYIVNHKDKTLPEFLEWIKANGYTFDKNMTDFSIEKDYIDFSGNLNEYSAAFWFRIYDKEMANHLMNTIDAPRKDYTKE